MLKTGSKWGVNYEVKTFEDAMVFLNALEYSGAYDRVSYVLEFKPEMMEIRRHIFARYLGLTREVISRAISEYRRTHES